MNIEIKTQADVDKVQKEFDDLLAVCKSQKIELSKNGLLMVEANRQINTLTELAISLSDTLKATHSVLGRKKDMFKGDDEMTVILNSLATFVLSSGAIKLGVVSNATDTEL